MNNLYKHPLIGFLLSVFPGGGQFYYQNTFRGIFYLLATIVPVLGAGFLAFISYNGQFMIISVVGVFFYLVSFIDTIMVGLRWSREVIVQSNDSTATKATRSVESERFFTIVLSFIPGVGHFQLGLMNRGFTFLTAFIGAGIMIIFTAVMLRQDAFLIFMAFLPVVWVYSFFDAIQQLNKKQRGEELEDRSILEDLEKSREDSRKSKAIATLLSIFPGAGHLYLGYQRRGIQLMAAFLLTLYILDVLRLGIFLFLIPIIWFYSFFDGLQKASRDDRDELVDDVPVISYLVNHQRWIGIGLIVLGMYFMFDRVFMPSIAPKLTKFLQIDISRWYYDYFQIIVVSVLLIGGGFKLMIGSKAKGEDAS